MKDERRLTLYLHKTFFVVKLHDRNLIPTMYGIINGLKTYQYVWNRRFRRMTKQEDKTYCSVNLDKLEYRFTISMLRDVVLTFKRDGVEREDINLIRVINKNIQPLGLNFKYDKYTPRDYQQQYIDILVNERINKSIMLVDLNTGYGKMQDLNTKIRVPNGWKRMGDIKVGDEVITEHGTKTKVTGVYPHGKKDMYKITFYDGRTARCGLEHLWYIYSASHNRWITVNTAFLIHAINRSPNKSGSTNHLRYYVPVVTPEKNEDKDFFIHPYILGCILGDGGISNGSVNLHVHDQQIIDKIKNLIREDYELREFRPVRENGTIHYKQSIIIKDKNKTKTNKYTSELSRLGLLYKTALEKFIPEEYLNGSAKQRWELLRGLMDTDGYVGKPHPGRNGSYGKCGTISYATSSPKLRDTFLELVRSLGGIVSYFTKYPTYTYNGVKKKGKPSYVMTLRLKYPDMCVTRTNKRAERLTHTNQYSKYFKLRIDKIEKIGKMEAQCISVANSTGLYVCDNYVITHNTTIGTNALTVIDERAMILVLPKYVDKWISDIKMYTNIQDDDICVIQGSKKIRELMNTDSNKLKYKVYIASITTMNYMISDFEDPTGIYYTTYPMEPNKFMDHLGVGVILNDETHQHFHALLKISLYMNVNQIIGLSATLDSNRAEMKKMYNHMFPPENRISNIVAIDRYVNVLAIEYKMISLKGIKYLQGGQGYSHIVFEQSILRNKSLRESYMEMIYYYVKSKYLDRKLPGERCLIFMSTVMFCTLFTKYLKSKHKNMDIRRYCQDDPYENVINAEICVSTVISASTAVDIPKLITVVNTISMASLQANIQTMGRLRKIPDRDTWYVYMYTPQILNQKNMHKIRRDTIKDRAKCVYYAEYPKYLQSN